MVASRACRRRPATRAFRFGGLDRDLHRAPSRLHRPGSRSHLRFVRPFAVVALPDVRTARRRIGLHPAASTGARPPRSHGTGAGRSADRRNRPSLGVSRYRRLRSRLHQGLRRRPTRASPRRRAGSQSARARRRRRRSSAVCVATSPVGAVTSRADSRDQTRLRFINAFSQARACETIVSRSSHAGVQSRCWWIRSTRATMLEASPRRRGP